MHFWLPNPLSFEISAPDKVPEKKTSIQWVSLIQPEYQCRFHLKSHLQKKTQTIQSLLRNSSRKELALTPLTWIVFHSLWSYTKDNAFFFIEIYFDLFFLSCNCIFSDYEIQIISANFPALPLITYHHHKNSRNFAQNFIYELFPGGKSE